MRESGDEKSTLRQIEKIKALSEDMLEYQAIDVHKAWQSMEPVSYTHLPSIALPWYSFILPSLVCTSTTLESLPP